MPHKSNLCAIGRKLRVKVARGGPCRREHRIRERLEASRTGGEYTVGSPTWSYNTQSYFRAHKNGVRDAKGTRLEKRRYASSREIVETDAGQTSRRGS